MIKIGTKVMVISNDSKFIDNLGRAAIVIESLGGSFALNFGKGDKQAWFDAENLKVI